MEPPTAHLETDAALALLVFLAAEITALTGNDPSVAYEQLTGLHGRSFYKRIDAPANSAQKSVLKALSPGKLDIVALGGEPVLAKMSTAPGNSAPIGGVKIIAREG